MQSISRRGSAQEHGRACLFLFPFDVHTTKEIEAPRAIHFDGYRVVVYWPYVNAEGNAPLLPQIAWDSVPVPPGTTPLDPRLPRFESTGILRNWDRPAAYANALRVDFFPEPDLEFVTENLNRLMRLFRWWTSQWWITRDRSFMEAPLRAALSINELGEPLNQLYGYATKIGTLGYERLLDEKIFTGVCQAFAVGRDIPISTGAFLDSIYSHSLQNTRQSLFEASIACESAIQEAAAIHATTLQVPLEEIERSLKGSDLLFNLDRGVKAIFGRSFRQDHPEQYEWIRTLWVARGRVAHGKSSLIVHDGQRRAPTPEDRVEIIHSVQRLFFWFQSIQSEAAQ